MAAFLGGCFVRPHLCLGASPPFPLRYAREGWCSPRPAEAYYEDPLVLTHDEGHQFPFRQPRAREVYEAVAAAIRRHLGIDNATLAVGSARSEA